LIIGDDWFTKSMLINTIYRNEKLRSQLGLPTSDIQNDFAEILNQLLLQKKEGNDTVPHTSFQSFEPNMTISNTPLNTNEPLRFESLSPEKLDLVLAGKLKGMGQAFVRAGQQYNVNPALLAAIAQHETGNGKSKAAIEKNNVAGMMGVNGLKSYSSVEDSINDMARNLSKNYLGLGLSTIVKIGSKYAPVGAENDPTGLNNHWVTGVTKKFSQILV
jgi:beta-N-acetylglucosaminidase